MTTHNDECLKPCPFCDGKGSAKRTYEPDWWQVVFSHDHNCPLGKVSNPYKSAYSTESEAIAEWNRRPSQPSEEAIRNGDLVISQKKLTEILEKTFMDGAKRGIEIATQQLLQPTANHASEAAQPVKGE